LIPKEVTMNPAQDALYRIHQFQARQRGQSALPYDQFSARVRATTDTDLTGLLLPPTEVRIEILATRGPKFSLGQLCITPRAATAVPPNEMLRAIARHAAGDWGTLDEHDRQENERALGTRGRLVSSYQASNGSPFWVITDAGWALTNVELHISDVMLSLQKC
jgi:hypothetical protein